MGNCRSPAPNRDRPVAKRKRSQARSKRKTRPDRRPRQGPTCGRPRRFAIADDRCLPASLPSPAGDDPHASARWSLQRHAQVGFQAAGSVRRSLRLHPAGCRAEDRGWREEKGHFDFEDDEHQGHHIEPQIKLHETRSDCRLAALIDVELGRVGTSGRTSRPRSNETSKNNNPTEPKSTK